MKAGFCSKSKLHAAPQCMNQSTVTGLLRECYLCLFMVVTPPPVFQQIFLHRLGPFNWKSYDVSWTIISSHDQLVSNKGVNLADYRRYLLQISQSLIGRQKLFSVLETPPPLCEVVSGSLGLFMSCLLKLKGSRPFRFGGAKFHVFELVGVCKLVGLSSGKNLFQEVLLFAFYDQWVWIEKGCQCYLMCLGH